MTDINDTLRTAGAGYIGWWATFHDYLPDIVSLCVGLATLTYLILKITKEILNWRL